MLTFRDSRKAFAEAIADGRLSEDHEAANYAGLFMYMGTRTGEYPHDLFKNIFTREYLP